MLKRRTQALSTTLDVSSPPREFRLFHAGQNESTKGTMLFDARAAELVMAKYRAHGVDQMIDLEHESLDKPTRTDSRDARGWYELEVRRTAAGPELWAVNVRWTSDGLRRLSEKSQRYISPAFYQDEDGRVVEMVNCALTALPATHAAPALVAAARYGAKNSSVVPVRMTNAQRQRLDVVCALHDATRSEIMRRAFARLSAGLTPAAALDELMRALQLPDGATPDQILAGVRALLENAHAPTPDVAAKLAARGLSRTEFARRKAEAVRRVGPK